MISYIGLIGTNPKPGTVAIAAFIQLDQASIFCKEMIMEYLSVSLKKNQD